MSTFVNNDVSPGDIVRASDHNEQGSRIAAVLNGGIETTNIADSAITTAKLANSSVTNSKLDATAGEIGGALATWTPTLSGFSSDPPGAAYYYKRTGKLYTLYIVQPTAGTSNSTVFTISLPPGATARTITNFQWQGYGQGKDNGAGLTNPILLRVASNGTLVDLYKDWSGAVWTSSGDKHILAGTITYEAA